MAAERIFRLHAPKLLAPRQRLHGVPDRAAQLAYANAQLKAGLYSVKLSKSSPLWRDHPKEKASCLPARL